MRKYKVADMKTINWDQMSELGLLERINKEILHPLGLAASRDLETGISKHILVAFDGKWEYDPDGETTIISDEEVRIKLADMVETVTNQSLVNLENNDD